MHLSDCQHLLTSIKGVTFASLDAIVEPKPGVELRITGERVLLYQNKNVSGYETLVKRRLEQAGKNPDAFVADSLPWGERIDGTPIIVHKDRHYLQCIVLEPGEYHYFIGDCEINPRDVNIFPKYPNQGLPPENSVYVHTYRLSNIVRLTLLNETVGERLEGTLKPNFGQSSKGE